VVTPIRRGTARRLGVVLRLEKVRPRFIITVRRNIPEAELAKLRERFEAVARGPLRVLPALPPMVAERRGQNGSPARTAQPRRVTGCGVRRSRGSRRASTCSCATSSRRRRTRSAMSRA
jgi:hypothetical protein